MKILLKTGILILFAGLFSACILQNEMGGGLYLGQKDSCGFAVSQFTGDGVRWDKSKFPISFYIHESVPPEAHKNFISAYRSLECGLGGVSCRSGMRSPFLLFAIVVAEGTQYSGSPREMTTYNILFFIDR